MNNHQFLAIMWMLASLPNFMGFLIYKGKAARTLSGIFFVVATMGAGYHAFHAI